MTELIDAWRLKKTNDKIMESELNKNNSFLLERFSNNIEFGTAGIRGVMGAGLDRVNAHTISMAALAYGKFLIETVPDAKIKGVIIGHDNRHNAKVFTEHTAKVMMALGIKVHIFNDNELQPTPLISYAIRKLSLAGGVVITASHNPKEYNGFKVYNYHGAQLLPSDTNKIQEYMSDINPLEIVKSDQEPLMIDDKIVSQYIDEVLKIQLRDDEKTIKVVFTPQHGTARVIGPKILEKMNVEYSTVESQMVEDPNFSHTRTPNPEDGRSLDKAIGLARKTKSDIAVTTDPDADRFGVAVKYLKRYKYLNGNQIASLYLDYHLQTLKEKELLPKNGYIVTSVVSGILARKIAEKHGVKVYETHVGFKNMANLIDEKKDETFIMAFEESYGFLLDANISRDKDAFQAIVGVVEMANYYKSQGKDLYSRLKEIFAEFGIHRTTSYSLKLSSPKTKRLMNRMLKIKTIQNKKVINAYDYRKTSINNMGKLKLIKLTMDDGSWLAIRPSGTEPKIKVYVQSVGNEKSEFIDVVEFEKYVSNVVRDNTETFEVKKFSWKVVFKYMVFLGIIIGMMGFVFTIIYDAGESGDSFANALTLFRSSNRFLWFLPWIAKFVFNATNAFSRYRMIKYTGGYVRLRDLQIASLMGGIIAYLTPFAIGGDAIVYWYLRRKGAERGPLIASLMSATTVYQLNTVLETIVLMAIGWPVYQHILFNGASPEAYAASIMFVSGLAWNLFSAIMIITLTTIKSFQEFIVKTTIRFLEWLPFIHIIDPGKTSSGYIYEFRQMRNGMKKLWTNKFLMIQIMIIKLLPSLISGGALALSLSGWIKSDLGNGYIVQLVGKDVIKTANSFSLTPGGSGISEWLSVTINSTLYNGTNKGISFEPKVIATSFDVMWKIIFNWPSLAISAFTVFTVLIGESKLSKNQEINKNITLSNSGKTLQPFYYYKGAFALWTLSMIGFTCFFFLV